MRFRVDHSHLVDWLAYAGSVAVMAALFIVILFEGENGFKMAPQGSRVLIMNKERAHRCDGRCEICRCGKRRSPILRGIKKQLTKNFWPLCLAPLY